MSGSRQPTPPDRTDVWWNGRQWYVIHRCCPDLETPARQRREFMKSYGLPLSQVFKGRGAA